MRHIDHQIGTNLIGYIAKTLPVDNARVGRKTGYDHFGFVLICQTLHFVIVDDAGLTVQTVLNCVVDLS